MCVTTNGTLSKANLTTGNVQYSRPQPHVKLTLQYIKLVPPGNLAPEGFL